MCWGVFYGPAWGLVLNVPGELEKQYILLESLCSRKPGFHVFPPVSSGPWFVQCPPLSMDPRVVDFSVPSGFFLFVGWTVISMILACGALYFCLHVPSISLVLKCVLTSQYFGTHCFHSYNQVSKISREACVSMSAYVTKHTFSLTFHLLHWLLS